MQIPNSHPTDPRIINVNLPKATAKRDAYKNDRRKFLRIAQALPSTLTNEIVVFRPRQWSALGW